MKIGTDIAYARYCLEQGKLVAIPTETVYGLAANGLNPEAVAQIFEAKQRPSFNPLILHVATLAQAEDLVKVIPHKAYILAKNIWPGPLTLILPKKEKIPDIVTSGLDTVGIRIPAHPLTRSLLKLLDFPLAAPSANLFGYVSPTTPQHVVDQLGDKVAYILDGGRCEIGIESTIVYIETEVVTILRLGGVDVEKIQELVGAVVIKDASSISPAAPGMLPSHYAPGKKLLLGNIEEHFKSYTDKKVGILSFMNSYSKLAATEKYILSPSGSLKEAAKNIFYYLRRLDNSDVDVILAELLPETGLGRAINDRLKRAAVKE